MHTTAKLNCLPAHWEGRSEDCSTSQDCSTSANGCRIYCVGTDKCTINTASLQNESLRKMVQGFHGLTVSKLSAFSQSQQGKVQKREFQAFHMRLSEAAKVYASGKGNASLDAEVKVSSSVLQHITVLCAGQEVNYMHHHAPLIKPSSNAAPALLFRLRVFSSSGIFW